MAETFPTDTSNGNWGHPTGSALHVPGGNGHEPEPYGWASHVPSGLTDGLAEQVRVGSGHRRARVPGVHVDLGITPLAGQGDTEHCRPVRDLDRQLEDL